jgi:hypothetical protein
VIRPSELSLWYDGGGNDFDTGARLPWGTIPEAHSRVPLSTKQGVLQWSPRRTTPEACPPALWCLDDALVRAHSLIQRNQPLRHRGGGIRPGQLGGVFGLLGDQYIEQSERTSLVLNPRESGGGLC